MGYERKSLQILGGGFNLLPPPDKIPSTDYLLAQNWRVDRVGKLVSRAGYQPFTSISGCGYLHSAAIFGGDIYYVGNHVGGAFVGVLFFNGSQIATGLTGNRVGMVGMNGWMWIMDRAVQVRHNATDGLQTWGLQPPTNACTAAAGAADPNGPNGSYRYYVTFATADQSTESNPGPISNLVTVSLQDVVLSSIPICPATPIGGQTFVRNVYAVGGSLAHAYLVQTISDNSTTTVTVTMSDLAATNQGIQMPTTNDQAPPAQGLGGPYFDRLIAWRSDAHPNRLWWTDAGLPQYWPGANDPADGNWVDVGPDGEAILWCTFHTNVMVIYKERSIWWLTGDPDTGTLEQIDIGFGAINPWAIVNGGAQDFFVAPNALCQLTLSPLASEVSPEIRPLFQSNLTNTGGALQTPGRVAPEEGTPFGYYGVSLGYGMGKLYVAYREQALADNTPHALLVYNGERWMYHRSPVFTRRIFGFLFTGIATLGLGGDLSSTGLAYNVDDFTVNAALDNGHAIECVYQSHYEHAGQPDNQKNWLELAIDYEFAGDTATVYVGLTGTGQDGEGSIALTSLGTITGNTRRTANFAIGLDGSGNVGVKTPSNALSDGVLAKALSVAIDCQASALVTIHNVYLYYYSEARLGLSASTIPLDLGSGKVKQCKELELDVDASTGPASVSVYSDLPGNQLAVRQTAAIARNGGRAVMKYPFATTEGFLWRLALNALTPFRLYGARLLMRVVGVYVEAYESAAGFVWDSMEQTFDSGMTKIPRQYGISLAALPIKRFRELSLEIETFGGNVTVSWLTDLPGDSQAVRFQQTINTGSAGRRFVRLVMAAGTAAPIEGRMGRLQLSGASKFILYEAAVEVLPVGVYIQAYEGAEGAVWDSREQDFGSAKAKEARELQLDLEASGTVVATVYSDLPGYTMTPGVSMTVATTGRQAIRLPLTISAVQSVYPMGRMFRVLLYSFSDFRLYGARLRLREFGSYLTGDEALGGAVWDSTPIDMGVEQVKEYKRIELDLQTDSTNEATVAIYTSQSGSLQQVYSKQITTDGLHKTTSFPLPPGTRGRLIQIFIAGTGVRLFAGRVWWRPLNDAQAQWSWGPLPIPPTAPEWADAPFPIQPTPPGNEPAQWWWAKLLSVEDTPDTWTWVDVPFEVTG